MCFNQKLPNIDFHPHIITEGCTHGVRPLPYVDPGSATDGGMIIRKRSGYELGFVARPTSVDDGSLNLMSWQCTIPGKPGTDWEGGHYPVALHFCEDYPTRPPICKFPPNFFHPNVYLSGMVCLSILSESEGWRPAITVRQILIGIQDLLDQPNPASPAQTEALKLLTQNPAEYERNVREQAKRYPPPI